MPPDSSILPNPQARPCATLALRPGWLASGLGVGARTGLHAELTAYSIVFWGHDALPAQDMVAWQQEKARLMAEMSLAGQKGAYGKLGALSSGLNRAFDDHIELSLRAGAGTHVRTEEVQALANGLAEETSCRVLAWSVCRNHVHVIAELTEEKGVDELVRHALHIAKYQERPGRQDFCSENEFGGAVHRCIHAVSHLIEDHAEHAGIPLRFAASKIIEGDHLILQKLELDENEHEAIEHLIVQMEKERGLDRSAAIADMRFNFIEKVCEKTVVKPKASRERIRSEKIDRILTGKYTAIPCFIGIMLLVFFLTFHVIGAFLQNLLAMGIDALSNVTDRALTAAGVNEVLHGLIIDGIFAGVGSVLSFLPIIVTLFFFLSLMEDSGYIARVAFFMDKLLRKIGLSGRSIVPMLIGFGCTVPAVMSTRTLPSERDRKMTILLTPFMSCSAKLPIYAFFTSAFFPEYGAFVMCALYLTGIMIGILVALLYRKTLFRGDAVPFVMELPNYRLPGLKNVMQLLWEKAKDFLQKAFTVIFVATICIWFLQKFDLHFNLVADSKDSILAMISNCLVPIFAPLGLGDWRICTSLISGVMAKESVISTLEILFGGAVKDALTPVAAASLLVFSLLYTPCIAAIASIRRELGRKWAVGMVIWQCMIAWVAAFAVRWLMVLFMR
jgi:ferrous iron transport protein B